MAMIALHTFSYIVWQYAMYTIGYYFNDWLPNIKWY